MVIRENANQSETFGLLDRNKDLVGENDKNEARKQSKEVRVNKQPVSQFDEDQSNMSPMPMTSEKDQTELQQLTTDMTGSDKKEKQNSKTSIRAEKLPIESDLIQSHSSEEKI